MLCVGGIVFFYRTRDSRRWNPLTHVVVPLIGAVVFGAALYGSVHPTPVGILAWTPLLALVWLVIGVATVLGWGYALDWLSYRVPLIHKLLHSPPVPLIRDGRVCCGYTPRSSQFGLLFTFCSQRWCECGRFRFTELSAGWVRLSVRLWS